MFDLVTDHEAFPGTIPFVAESRLREDEQGPIVFQRVVQSHGLASPALAVAKKGWDEVLAAGLGNEDPARQVSWAYENG